MGGGSISLAVIAFIVLAYNAWELGFVRVLVIGIAALSFGIFALIAGIAFKLIGALDQVVGALQGVG
jgi:hypothetical protein